MEKNITGIMMYYYKVCHRKLWYFYHSIQMEQNSDDVALGKMIDENSYKNDEKHVNVDNTINIDFIKSTGVLHEVKKSNKIEEASIFQVKYYLYYLKKKDVNLTAKIDYPKMRKVIEVKLCEDDIVEIEQTIDEIRKIVDCKKPPKLTKKKICKKCAFYDLCYI